MVKALPPHTKKFFAQEVSPQKHAQNNAIYFPVVNAAYYGCGGRLCHSERARTATKLVQFN